MTDGGYSSVTNPERFAALHGAVMVILGELEQRYVIAVEAVTPEQGQSTPPVLSVIRLRPPEGGAPVEISLTGFPGLFVRFGESYEEAFPQCGCDGCNEQVDDLIGDLRRKLWSVANGRFEEPPGGGRFVFDEGWSESTPSRAPRGVPMRSYTAWPHR